MHYPDQTKIVTNDTKNHRAVFEIGPLYPGYGVTIGNVMRRVLISSISGAAVTSAKIKGVDHEFTSIDGVLEDVVAIIMNLKKVRFRSHSDEPVTVTLEEKGQKEVTAKDIKVTSDIEVVNPDQIIATLSDKKSSIEMELVIEQGMGYVPVEQKQKEKLSVGEIAIDAIFTPIKNVTFEVQNVRVGQRTDYNKVLLDITTDGSVTPQEAFKTASEILTKHFEIIHNIESEALAVAEENK